MKGILFKPWKIKAIAESPPDREWQTRRIIKPQPTHFHYDSANQFKPRYQVGETVYIKEAYWQDLMGGLWAYKSDMEWPSTNCAGKGISPMFMPAWAARYHIQITAVRAERLQEISPLDAVNEGCPKYHEYNDKWECIKTISPIDRFHLLWDSINPKHQWSDNDLVWVYSFKRLEVSDGD